MVNGGQRWKKYSIWNKKEVFDLNGKTVQLFLERLAEQKRNESTEKLKSVSNSAEWEKRRTEIKKALAEALGGLPHRGDCKWKLAGKIQRDNYIIENIIIYSVDSMPINLNLFIPLNVQGR